MNSLMKAHRTTELAPSTAAFGAKRGQFGVNVIGHVSANIGIGVSARYLVQLLLDRNCPVAIFDMDPGLGRGKYDLTFDRFALQRVEDLPYSINLVILPAATLPHFFLDVLPRWSDGLNVGLIYWEISAIPQLWKEALHLFDVMVAPSNYIRSVFEAQLSGVRHVSLTHPIYCPDDIRPSRARFGLSNDEVVFITGFEPTSDPQRKNPFAAVQAFQTAFGSDTRARLIIKVNNSNAAGEGRSLLERLKQRCAADSRISINEEKLSYTEVLTLYSSCDVFVSLHRSEGLGLALMEAMALGKPVIATGWSGNMTYMNHTNSCLVRYRLIAVEGALSVYKRRFLEKDTVWADPDIEDAALWMKRLANDRALRVAVGAKAAADIASFHNEACRATFLDELRAISEQQAFLPKWTESKRRHRDNLQRLAHPPTKERIDAMVRALRRARAKTHRLLDRYVLWRFRA